jgi:hypothetical protein
MQFNSVRSTILSDGDSISGRVWLLGIVLTPIFTARSQTPPNLRIDGTIRFWNGTSATGDPLVEVPVTIVDDYPAGIGFNYIEHGGYMLFPDGLIVGKTASTGDPLGSDTSLSVYYQV